MGLYSEVITIPLGIGFLITQTVRCMMNIIIDNYRVLIFVLVETFTDTV